MVTINSVIPWQINYYRISEAAGSPTARERGILRNFSSRLKGLFKIDSPQLAARYYYKSLNYIYISQLSGKNLPQRHKGAEDNDGKMTSDSDFDAIAGSQSDQSNLEKL
jgi:hypothetical protein